MIFIAPWYTQNIYDNEVHRLSYYLDYFWGFSDDQDTEDTFFEIEDRWGMIVSKDLVIYKGGDIK